MRNVPAICLFLLISLTPMQAYTAETDDGTSVDPHAFLGSYEFEDGIRISGGRFDEGGQELLLYMDTATVSRGISLKPAGAGFVPVFDTGEVDLVDFNDDASIMRWHAPSGNVMEARRVMHPRFLPASFSNGDVSLAGTLYLPPDIESPLAAVVLAHGSGPVTRHGGTWITFFLEQGMAVLSYDKRGSGKSSGNWKTASYRHLSEDLSAAVGWLKLQSQIDGKRIGLHTTSQSGWYGPHTARMDDSVTFLIQRVGPAVDIGTGTAHEKREEWRADGIPESYIEPAIDFWLKLHGLAAKRASLEAANALLDIARKADWFATTYGEWKAIDPGWWQRHVANMQLDPSRDAARLEIPILWFLADQDENVPYESSLKALQLARAENARLKIVSVHNSPHGFLIRDEKGGMRFTSQYWSTMAGWLHEIGMSRPSGRPSMIRPQRECSGASAAASDNDPGAANRAR